MFGVYDVWKFLLAFFLIFPIVTFIHLLGHIFFVKLFGGKNTRMIVGCGEKLCMLGKIEIRKFYFWSGRCEFSYLKFNNRLTNSLIILGGSLFNLISMLIVNSMIKVKVLEPSMFWDQFVYFSFYFVFFALFPMDNPTGIPSDGKAAYLLWKKKTKKTEDDFQCKNHST
ncbi:hypothetical protein ACFOU2_18680 [Bacillus songklensis]|uniref:Uncharacterized protein n=1 Tax=Bacillus songklensis TaxID=1069116 RepID=A0ABV8B5D7_9BACI